MNNIHVKELIQLCCEHYSCERTDTTHAPALSRTTIYRQGVTFSEPTYRDRNLQLPYLVAVHVRGKIAQNIKS